MKTVIFGGSFDPPHNGHIEIIRELRKRFERVIVVPCRISPFKQGASAASAADRLTMLRLALKDVDVEISDYELNRDVVSYSIDTVRHFAAETGTDELYFAVGSESVKTLHLWKDARELFDKVIFYVIPRPDFVYREETAARIVKADFVGADYSSCEFKAAMAFGKAEQMTTPEVYEYIVKRGLYRDYCAYTAAYAEFGLKKQRIEHTYCAVQAGIKLAKKHGVSTEKTITALVIHDIAKYVTAEDLTEIGIKHGDYTGMPSDIKHAFLGADIAENYFGIADKEICDAIRYHTTGRPNMTPLEEVVALADYIEAGRDFEGLDEIRAAADGDLSAATEMMLDKIMLYLRAENKEIFGLTQAASDSYKEKKNGT